MHAKFVPVIVLLVYIKDNASVPLDGQYKSGFSLVENGIELLELGNAQGQ